MRALNWQHALSVVTTLTWTAALSASACSGSSSGADGGFGGAGVGGSAATGGVGANPGTGGTISTGGTGGNTGGAPGTGGATADASTPCPAPADPTKSAICIELEPETISFDTQDPDLDGLGVLVVEVFDAPDPELPDGGSIAPLHQVTFGADGGQLDISTTIPPQRFDDLPSTVYVRATFVDASSSDSFPRPGVWLGGVDLNQGLERDARLLAVNLVRAEGRTVTVPLRALRRLEVEVSLGAGVVPVDDAQGPGSFLALSAAAPISGQVAFGVGESDCVDVSGGRTDVISGVVIGEGPYFLFSALDDFRIGGLPAPGAIVTLDLDDAGAGSVPSANRFSVPVGAYEHRLNVEYNRAMALGDAGAPPSFSCGPNDGGSFDGSPPDGGADADGDSSSADASADGSIDASPDGPGDGSIDVGLD